MSTITTRRDQRDTAAAARRVGGYQELVRLANERRHSAGGTVARDATTGRWGVRRDRDPD
ncbi:hypothetical protein [Sphingomonas sp. BK345]|uniref:hypothetical protein n=1 Tax=Sphingomonas sp. BK345 TaxID=2586980 RepID=UPI00160CB6A1|nr:hypothetical protein [Sphingomonas sp. BK345]MBB3473484.1 hypothetical protein [Sphingomonas sp. BK345]